MTFFASALSCFSDKPTPYVSGNMPLDSWCRLYGARSTRFVQKVELCTALALGQGARGEPVDKTHRHTFLRLSVSPIPGYSSEDSLLIERVLSFGDIPHFVAPVLGIIPVRGSLGSPHTHDRACSISDGPSTPFVRHLQIERTVTFGDGEGPWLTVAQFARIIRLVSHKTLSICPPGDCCQSESRFFAFACMAALTPSSPPPTSVKRGTKAEVDDSVFESKVEVFLSRLPSSSIDHTSVQTLKLIKGLRDQPRGRAEAILYH